jgi:hypothetical protein
MRSRQHGQEIDGAQQAPAKPRIARARQAQMNIATVEAARQTRAAVLDQMDFDSGMAPPIPLQEPGEQCLHHLRCGADPQ